MKSPVILVTGAGKGIGRATVEEIFRLKSEFQSPRLFLISRTESDLVELRQLAEAHQLDCEISALDFSIEPEKTIQQVLQKWGRLDYLVHSAGVGRFRDFLQITHEDVTFVLKTNVEASFFLMQEAYRCMQKQKSGTIVWITSVAAEKPFEQSSVYCMSKFAQRGLIEVMRQYGRKDGVRIIDVKPGATITPMWGEIDASLREKMMEAEDVARILVQAMLLPARASVEDILIRPLHGDI